MWYPTPYYKEFFAYLTTLPHLWWGQKIDASRWKFNTPLLDFQKNQREVHLLGAGKAFVECIYITGGVSANAPVSDTIDMRVIFSSGRFYLWYASFLLRVTWKNIRRKRAHKPLYSISVAQSLDNTAVPVRRLQDDPVWIWYMLLHLIPVYLKYENNATRIYEQNSRLDSYFPQFPGQSLIWANCETMTWSSSVKKGLENALSGIWWTICNAVMYIWYHIYARCTQNSHEFFLKTSYWKFPDIYETILLKRKAIWRK